MNPTDVPDVMDFFSSHLAELPDEIREKWLGQYCYTLHEVIEEDCYGFFSEPFLKMLGRKKVMLIDIGANYGVTANVFRYITQHARGNPHTKVRCYEPDMDTFRVLTLMTKGKGIACFPIGLGIGEPLALMPITAGASPMCNQYRTTDEGTHESMHAAYGAPLLDLIPREVMDDETVVAVKIDCEGGEYVLPDYDDPELTHRLKRVDHLAIEVHSYEPKRADEVRKFLEEVLGKTHNLTTKEGDNGSPTVIYTRK